MSLCLFPPADACYGDELAAGAEAGDVSVDAEGSSASAVVSFGPQLYYCLLTVDVMRPV